jgi:MATE family multidrug resistance protein
MRLFRYQLKSLWAISVPLAISQMTAMALGLVDTLMIARLGPVEVAASALAGGIWHALLLFGIGVVSVVSPMAAQAYGANKPRTMRRIVRQGIWLSFILGAILMVPAVDATLLLQYMGQDPAAVKLGAVYISGLQWGMIPELLFIVFRSYVSAYNITRPILIICLAMIPLNAAVNYGLIYGHFGLPRLELYGAGLGSALVYLWGAVTLALYICFHKSFRRRVVFNRIWRADWKILLDIVRLGVPSGLSFLSETLMFTACNLIIGLVSTAYLAVQQIVLMIIAFVFMIFVGLSQAVTIRVGYAMGRKDYGEARLVHKAGLLSAVLASSMCGLFILLFQDTLAQWFLKESGAQADYLIALFKAQIWVTTLFVVVDAVHVVTLGTLRGMKDIAWATLFGTLIHWTVGVGGAYIYAVVLDYKSVGIWFALMSALCVAAVLYNIRLRKSMARA